MAETKRPVTLIVFLVLSLGLNLFFLANVYNLEIKDLLSKLRNERVIYQEDCPDTAEKNQICSIELLERRSDFAMIRVHYHYVKGEEYSNTIVVKANKGSHDNVIGTRGGFDLVEGDNTIDIPFGMYRPGSYTKERPYRSNYIMVEARGLTEDGKRYTVPHIFRVYAKYDQAWYAEGGAVSWH